MRDYYQLRRSDFWWSEVAADVPYSNLTAALVLDGVTIDRVTDFGTSYTTPEDYLDHLVGFGLFTTDGRRPGELRPVPLGRRSTGSSPRCARPSPRTTATSRRWTGDEKIRCGAYVYFSFLRPFAAEAGMADELRLDRATRTSPVRSTSWCRPWRGTTPGWPTKGRTTSPSRDMERGR